MGEFFLPGIGRLPSLSLDKVVECPLVGEGCLIKLHLIVDTIDHHITAIGEFGVLIADPLAVPRVNNHILENLATVQLAIGEHLFHIVHGADRTDFRGMAHNDGDPVHIGLVLDGICAAVLGACTVEGGDIGQNLAVVHNTGGIYYTFNSISKDIVVGVGKAVVLGGQIGVHSSVFHFFTLLFFRGFIVPVVIIV